MTATAELRRHGGIDDDDATLLARLRRGDVEPYAQLWRRHLASAYRVAHRYRGRASAEDIVGEASLRVFDRIQAGEGPTSNFRAYFLSVVKNVALDLGKADLRLVPTDSQDLEARAPAVAPYDATPGVDQDMVRMAFGRLSARDQQVLWHTAVLGEPAAVIGMTMGLSPNGVSAAAVRARDALRAAYLDAHADRAVAQTRSKECQWVLSQLGRYVRGTLRGNQRARVERHLRDCRHAQVLAGELTEINQDLPALMVPLIFVAGTHSAATWCSAWLAGSHGTVPHSVPVDQASTALGGVSAGTSGLITKVAVMVTVAALGTGLTSSSGAGVSPTQANIPRVVAALAEPGGDGMPKISSQAATQTTTPAADTPVATVGDQPKDTRTGDPTAAGAEAAAQAGVQAATTVSTGALTSPATTDAAPSTTGSSGTTASTTTTGTSSVTAKPKKTSPPQAPVSKPSNPPTTPPSPSSPTPVPLPPGQAKKANDGAAPAPNTCKNAWSQARACRTDTPP